MFTTGELVFVPKGLRGSSNCGEAWEACQLLYVCSAYPHSYHVSLETRWVSDTTLYGVCHNTVRNGLKPFRYMAIVVLSPGGHNFLFMKCSLSTTGTLTFKGLKVSSGEKGHCWEVKFVVSYQSCMWVTLFATWAALSMLFTRVWSLIILDGLGGVIFVWLSSLVIQFDVQDMLQENHLSPTNLPGEPNKVLPILYIVCVWCQRKS